MVTAADMVRVRRVTLFRNRMGQDRIMFAHVTKVTVATNVR